MDKRVIATPQSAPSPSQCWLNVEGFEVEVTSEEQAHPIVAALLVGEEQSWRASESGEQTIRLIFTVRNFCRGLPRWLVKEIACPPYAAASRSIHSALLSDRHGLPTGWQSVAN